MATSAGHGFVCKLGDLLSRNRGGKGFVTLGEEGDAALAPQPLTISPIDLAADTDIACLSSDGYLLVFPAAEIKKLSGGGRGVTLQDLSSGAQLIAALPIGAKGVVVAGKGGRGKDVRLRLAGEAIEPHRGRRARKGRKVPKIPQAPRLVKPDADSNAHALD